MITRFYVTTANFRETDYAMTLCIRRPSVLPHLNRKEHDRISFLVDGDETLVTTVKQNIRELFSENNIALRETNGNIFCKE